MSVNETTKGIGSLTAAYQHDIDNSWLSKEELKTKLDWVLDRAQQYADYCHVTRDDVLSAWEKRRDYWWINFYQDANQPDLSKSGNHVLALSEWESEGRRRFGDEQLDWKFKCPACGHIQSMREFKDAGLEPNLAYLHCASRHGLGGKADCKWTIGGLFRIGGQYVIDGEYCPRLIFEFVNN